MDLYLDYRPLFKYSDVYITKGAIICADIQLPENYYFSNALLYQIGTGEKSKSAAICLASELFKHFNCPKE